MAKGEFKKIRWFSSTTSCLNIEAVACHDEAKGTAVAKGAAHRMDVLTVTRGNNVADEAAKSSHGCR